MNHLVKKAAVAKYGRLHAAGDTEEPIKAAIAEDEKKFTPEEVEEIYQAILAGDTGDPDPEKDNAGEQEKPKSKGKAAKAKAETPSTYIVCEEWRMENVNGKLEKLKLVRSNVKLTERVFEELNSSAKSTLIAYFKSEG